MGRTALVSSEQALRFTLFDGGVLLGVCRPVYTGLSSCVVNIDIIGFCNVHIDKVLHDDF